MVYPTLSMYIVTCPVTQRCTGPASARAPPDCSPAAGAAPARGIGAGHVCPGWLGPGAAARACPGVGTSRTAPPGLGAPGGAWGAAGHLLRAPGWGLHPLLSARAVGQLVRGLRLGHCAGSPPRRPCTYPLTGLCTVP